MQLGRRIGATTVLVRTGYGEQAAAEGHARADHVVADLKEAAEWISAILSSEDAAPAPQLGSAGAGPIATRE